MSRPPHNLSGPVVTGAGAVTPAGCGVESLWRAMMAARGLDRPLTDPAFAALPVRRACTLPPDAEAALPWPQHRIASMMALAGDEAIRQAGWDSATLSDPATALIGATSKGDPGGLLDLRNRWLAGQSPNGQTDDFLGCWPDGPGGRVYRHWRMAGPRSCTVAACATGAHAAVRAAQMIRDGDARRAVVVAADASILPLLMAAFARMGVLTAERCRPFDRDRSGFLLGEGAAAVTIERADDLAGGRPLAEIAGYLLAADPTGLTAQDDSGDTLAEAVGRLVRQLGPAAEGVGLYVAHGTATPSNDRAEAAAVSRIFANTTGGPHVLAAKPVVGHMLGAAGLVELVLAVEAIGRGCVPPLANLREQDPDCSLSLTTEATAAEIRTAVCTSVGFGGQLTVTAIRRPGR